MINLENIQKTFDTKDGKVTAVNGVNLSIGSVKSSMKTKGNE